MQVELELEVEMPIPTTDETLLSPSEIFELVATMEIQGSYRPATWDEPAEHPETVLVNLKFEGQEISPNFLTKKQVAWLEREALESA